MRVGTDTLRKHDPRGGTCGPSEAKPYQNESMRDGKDGNRLGQGSIFEGWSPTIIQVDPWELDINRESMISEKDEMRQLIDISRNKVPWRKEFGDEGKGDRPKTGEESSSEKGKEIGIQDGRRRGGYIWLGGQTAGTGPDHSRTGQTRTRMNRMANPGDIMSCKSEIVHSPLRA